MASRQWYTAVGGKQEGPFPDERLRELIANGTVTAESLVWCEGMTDWTKAGAVPGLVSEARRAATVPAAPPAAGSGDVEHLWTDVGVWPLLGRTLLLMLAEFVIIPLPWAATSYYRWFVSHIKMPQDQQVEFVGKPGDIWYIFMLSAACSYVGLIHGLLQLALIFLTTLFTLIIVRWFFANLSWEGRETSLRFTGGYWPLLGWTVLLAVSVVTIIGWAWVCTAWTRWMCKNVVGSERQLIFTASGWGVLWRTLLFTLSCVFIIPIPWTLHWIVRWFVSQFALANPGAAAIGAPAPARA